MSWALVLTATPDELEVIAADLFDLGALGVELQEPGMPLMPGTPELPPGRGRAIAHFDLHETAVACLEAEFAEAQFAIPDGQVHVGDDVDVPEPLDDVAELDIRHQG